MLETCLELKLLAILIERLGNLVPFNAGTGLRGRKLGNRSSAKPEEKAHIESAKHDTG